MKTCHLIAVLILTMLTACSATDSLQVFDGKQAANLLHENRTTHPAQQMIKVALPDKKHWKKIDMSYGTVGTPVMLVPQNEDRANWTQSIRTKIRAFVNDSDATAIKVAQGEIAAAKSQCAVADASILSHSKHAVIYRINMSNCHDQKNQLRVGKAFNGDDAIYLVYYTAVAGDVPAEQSKRLSRIVESAKLVRDPRWQGVA